LVPIDFSHTTSYKLSIVIATITVAAIQFHTIHNVTDYRQTTDGTL